jgi:hypothetical protein
LNLCASFEPKKALSLFSKLLPPGFFLVEKLAAASFLTIKKKKKTIKALQ